MVLVTPREEPVVFYMLGALLRKCGWFLSESREEFVRPVLIVDAAWEQIVLNEGVLFVFWNC